MRETILPKILAFLIRLINKTIRFKTLNRELLEYYQKQKRSLVYAFWHNRQFLLFGWNTTNELVALTSLSRDGRLQEKILRKLNFYPVSGSSSRGAVGGLISMIRAMREGRDACITVDGPRGPIYKAKPGAIYLANKTKSVIIPITTRAQHCYVLKNAWCKYEVPMPFSKAIVIIGQPIEIDEKLDDAKIEIKRQELENILNRITEQADNYFK